jgi:phosphotransferase system  glucose/maltose/N-acetylglucosamine-specific IIC component
MDWSLVITLVSILLVAFLVMYFFSKKNDLTKKTKDVEEAEVEEKKEE